MNEKRYTIEDMKMDTTIKIEELAQIFDYSESHLRKLMREAKVPKGYLPIGRIAYDKEEAIKAINNYFNRRISKT